MPTHIHIGISNPSKHQGHGERSHDDKQREGWAKERTALEQKPAPTLTSPGTVAGWVAKASARSGPAYAPGIGTRKSS
jgi:hypothetical protein